MTTNNDLINTPTFEEWKTEFHSLVAEFKLHKPKLTLSVELIDQIQLDAFSNLSEENSDIDSWHYYDESADYRTEFTDDLKHSNDHEFSVEMIELAEINDSEFIEHIDNNSNSHTKQAVVYKVSNSNKAITIKDYIHDGQICELGGSYSYVHFGGDHDLDALKSFISLDGYDEKDIPLGFKELCSKITKQAQESYLEFICNEA